MRPRLSSPVAGYVVAIIATAAAVFVRWALDPWVGNYLPLATLYGAVGIAVWFGGTRAAVLAVAIGYLACNYLFIEPRGLTGAQHLVGLLMYLASCAILIAFGEAMRRASRHLQEEREALRAKDLQLEEVTESTSVLLTHCSRDLRYVFVNRACAEFFGRPRDEIVGRPIRDILGAEAFEAIRPHIETVLQGDVVEYETELSYAGLGRRFMHVKYVPDQGPAGEVRGWFASITDVTGRRWAEAALRESEHRFRTLFESMEEGYCVIEVIFDAQNHPMDYRFLEINPAFEKQTGIKDAKGRLMREIAPDHEQHWFDIYGRIALSGETLRFENPAAALGRWYDVCAFRVGPAELRRVGIVFNDITDRRRQEQALREHETELRDAQRLAHVGSWRWEAATDATTGSEELYRIYGLDPAGPPFPDFKAQDGRLYPHASWEKIHAAVQEALRTGVGYELDVEALRDGTPIWVMTRCEVVRDAAGRVTGLRGTVQDITERKQAADALRQADRQKDDFLATLAHELRNPLAPVRNAIKVLQLKGPPVPELGWARDVIDRQMQQMTRLIDDLMDVSRIARNRLELRKERVELAEILQGAVETSRPFIDGSGHELCVTLPPERVYVDADPTRLAQVFANLLNNAAKYSEPHGQIFLNAERQGSDAVVSVRDRGIGIPKEMLGHVFDPFAQVDRSLERTRGGLGIGLTLVKRLVEMHGGSVTADSEGPGKGSEFIVRLPIPIAQPAFGPTATPDEPLRKAPARRRILIVDDNNDAATSLSMMLNILGYETRTAFDGVAGLEAACAFRPDVALMDIGMPRMNGYEVARRIREQPWSNGIVLIAVTGWGQSEDKQRATEAGFDHHLVKPVDPSLLTKLLASLAREHECRPKALAGR
jgi:PAS domain S-box-containing protein